jgi:CAAX protease family protein
VDTAGIEVLPARLAAARLRSLRAVGLAYLVAVAAAEASLAFANVAYGLAGHALVLVMLLGLAVLAPERPSSGEAQLDALDVLPVLALVPLLRIVSLTTPVPDLSPIYWYAATGGPILLAIALTVRFLGRDRIREMTPIPSSRNGFAALWSPLQGAIALSGVPLGLIAYLLLRPEPLEARPGPGFFVVGVVILVVFTGLTEELLFRGLLQSVFVELFGGIGVVLAAILSATMYLGTGSASFVVFAALVGLSFGVRVRQTGSLAGVILAHGLISVELLLVWPYVLG